MLTKSAKATSTYTFKIFLLYRYCCQECQQRKIVQNKTKSFDSFVY